MQFSNNLTLTVILKMGSRSPKSNQVFSMSQQYSCTSLVKIRLFIQEIGCIQNHFPTNLSPPVTLKMGSRSPKSNQFFYVSQHCRCASLDKICPFNKEIECRQVATPTPTGSVLKTICPPPPPAHGGGEEGDIIINC